MKGSSFKDSLFYEQSEPYFLMISLTTLVVPTHATSQCWLPTATPTKTTSSYSDQTHPSTRFCLPQTIPGPCYTHEYWPDAACVGTDSDLDVLTG